MNRRSFLQSILAAGVAPAFVGSSILMPVRTVWTPHVISAAYSWEAINEVPDHADILARLISEGMRSYQFAHQFGKMRLVEVLDHDRVNLTNAFGVADRVRLAVETA